MEVMQRYHFRWTCSYLGVVDYEITDGTGTYRAELRREASDYERGIYNGDEDQWQREVVASIGALHRYISTEWIPDETVRAFNEWRAQKHASTIAEMKAQPHRYGDPTTLERDFPPPIPAKSGRYVSGKGWEVKSV